MTLQTKNIPQGATRYVVVNEATMYNPVTGEKEPLDEVLSAPDYAKVRFVDHGESEPDEVELTQVDDTGRFYCKRDFNVVGLGTYQAEISIGGDVELYPTEPQPYEVIANNA